MSSFRLIDAIPVFMRPSASIRRRLPASEIRQLLEVRRLCFRRGYHTVLRCVDLSVAPGETVAILGANGAGKTTLLKCVAGALRPTSGEVRWCGEPAAQNAASRRQVGFVGHETGLYPELTGWENILLAGRMSGVDRIRERATELLRQCGFDAQAYQRVRFLSRGMRQRLAIIRATIHQPNIVILDEPFTNLDSAGRQWLDSYLIALRQRRCGIVFSCHDLLLARRVAGKVLNLQSGQLQDCDEHAETGPEPDRHLARSGT